MATVDCEGTEATPDLERALARLWAEVLEVPEVSPDGDFFSLGGNSMLGVELTFLIASELGTKVQVKLLVDAPTPAKMAEAIRRRAGAAART
jgi:hypothetical protein